VTIAMIPASHDDDTSPVSGCGPLGLILAAPSSSTGKTTLTLALLRLLRDAGRRVASVKIGPDYIDPAFHAAASGRPCRNLDAWAMRPPTLAELAWRAGDEAELVLAEGVMGLFDGVAGRCGTTAEVALATGWPVVLIVDVRGQAGSVAAVVHGFDRFHPNLRLAGVILNRVSSDRHELLLRRALDPLGIPVLGAVRRRPELSLPDRHLGLVQASEHPDLETFLQHAARLIGRDVDGPALAATARPLRPSRPSPGTVPGLPPLGQRIAIARDRAFAFAYDGILEGWQAAGAEILPFSPLLNQGPAHDADAVYLPGGYPELHAGPLANAPHFLDGLRAAAQAGKPIYGECGGYMVLGRGLVDAEGRRHAMAGLLELESSFAQRKLHLGYRQVELAEDTPFGPIGTTFRGHEFHFATVLGEPAQRPLFLCHDAEGTPHPPAGERKGSVIGSFIHLIDTGEP